MSGHSENNDNVRQRVNRKSLCLGTTGWEECGLEDYGGGGCCSCRTHLEAMKSHEKHSSRKRKQIQVSRFNVQTQWFQWNACLFVQILRSKPKADLMSVDCRIHSPSRIRSWNFWSPFCYVTGVSGVTFLLSFKLHATLSVQCPQGSTPTKPLPQKDIHQLHTCNQINQHPHFIIHMHIEKSSNSQANQQQSQYRRTYSCLYAYILQYMLCQTVKFIPPRNSTRNPCVSPWRQFQCLHAGNQNLCRCQR